jgi:hypothetical protein
MNLRPVTFRYKEADQDGSHSLQYGLIAEEVAKVYPDLVQYDKQGKPFTVYYHLLTPIMLDQLQKAHQEIIALKAGQQSQSAALQTLGTQTASLQHSNQLLLKGASTMLLIGLIGAAVYAACRRRGRTYSRVPRIETCAA